MTRFRDVRLIPLVFGPLISFMAIVETRLDDSFGTAATATWISGVVLGVGVVIGAWYPLVGTVIGAICLPIGVIAFGAPGIGGAAMIGLIGSIAWAAWRTPPRRSVIALCVASVSFASTSITVGGTLWELFFVPAVLMPGWFMALLARRSGERAVKLAELAAALDAEREANARSAVAQERTRIAREVHDAVAHSISVMTLQLGGLRRMLSDRPAEVAVIAGLEQLGRQTVEEMRGLVGILREPINGEPPSPAPSLARVDELISDLRAVGLEVALNAPAELPRLPPVLDLTAYRVLQEALTNVLKHAGQVPTTVVIGYSEKALTLEVRNQPGRTDKAGDKAGGVPVRGGGHGLVGMRERLTMVRGSLQAGPEPGGGFAVRARFPIPHTK